MANNRPTVMLSLKSKQIMAQYIDKSALVAEIERRIEVFTKEKNQEGISQVDKLSLGARIAMLEELKVFLDTLEVKEVDLDIKQRIEECPYRQIGCTMYNGHILECRGACSWIVDYPKLKELKAQKEE